MPSAEKSNTEAMKVEVMPINEHKSSENAQKDIAEHNGEKNIAPVQQVIQIIQNKVRNLEKRKNKLDGYIKEEEDGKELSSEQKKAVMKYEEVVSQLGISKEFCKQFQVIGSTAAKEQKRMERKAAFLKQMQETSKVREVIIIQDLLRQLKNETIRSDFLNAQNGACLIEAAEMDVLETFSKYTTPVHPSFSNEPSFSSSAKSSADYLSFVVDGRNRQFLETGFTFEKLKELFHRIQTCGYFEKDIKVVEEEVATPPESETPQSNTDDLESKNDVNVMVMETSGPSIVNNNNNNNPNNNMPTAPLPTQVPNPTRLFNGGNASTPGMIPVLHAPIQVIPQQQMSNNMKTTVTAVENAFYNQMKYSQGPMTNNSSSTNNNNNISSNNELPQQQPNRYIEDFASANISFLQDSLVEQIPNAGSQSPQQQMTVTHNFPPGLKVQQGNASNIPVSYSQQQTQQQQLHPQQQVKSQEPQHFQAIITSTVQYQQQPTNIPNIQNLQDVEQKTLNSFHQQNIDVGSDKSTSETPDRKMHLPEKENHRSNEWNPVNQQQPQIDTWNNDASVNSQGNYSRFNRNRGSGGGPKYNNYRNSQPARSNYNNDHGSGDSANREGGGTFFRNNERYNGGGSSGRYNNNMSERGNFNKRENFRTGGSGRFSSSMGSSNPVQRK